MKRQQNPITLLGVLLLIVAALGFYFLIPDKDMDLTTCVQPGSTASEIGFLPPYLLKEIAHCYPGKSKYLQTLTLTEKLKSSAQSRQGMFYQLFHRSARRVYDAKHLEDLPGLKARFEGEPPVRDMIVNNCYDYGGLVRDYYRAVHNREGLDGKGSRLKFVVHYGKDFENAYWDGEFMVFGDGDQEIFSTFVDLVVTGHELTHGVTENEARTAYWGMPGALNEHYSDVFGVLIKQWSLKQTAKQADWLIGDSLFTKKVAAGVKTDPERRKLPAALRDMLEPGTAYDITVNPKDPQSEHLKDEQPARLRDYKQTLSDNGGVHYNSGIANRAFALFAISDGGYAYEKPAQIWYRARRLAGRTPSFVQFAYWTVKACRQLYPGDEELVAKLKKAWSTVDVVPDQKEPDNRTPRIKDRPVH